MLKRIYYGFSLFLNSLGIVYVIWSLLTDLNQKLCGGCIENYYEFNWQGIMFTAFMIIFLIFLFMWQYFYQDSESNKKPTYLYQKKKNQKTGIPFRESPNFWLIVIFVWIFCEMVLSKLYLYVFVEPNFIGINENWLIFSLIYSLICSIGLYFIIGRYIYARIENI